VGLVGREPMPRTGTTQFTTDEGNTVELEGLEIGTPLRLEWSDIASGNVEPLIVSLDEAAEHHHTELSKYIFGSLETVTAATGNQVDASGKSFFEYMYEMFEKVELSFEADGRISESFALVTSPETWEVMQQKEAEMTSEERLKLDELIDRKRREYFAGRRSRKLS